MAKSAPLPKSVPGDEAAIAAAAAALTQCPRPVQIDCSVQHYDWGDPEFIPALLGRPNPGRRPFAELWIGAHPDLPSVARVGDTAVALNRLIAAAPAALLGRRVDAAFGGRLPFLFKVLAARQPLSIQVHPDLEQARAGFARETRGGIAADAATRNYRDDNHKPELLVALTDFYALRGFRPLHRIAETLAATPELATLADGLRAGKDRLAELYRHLMHLPRPAVDALLDPLLERLGAEHDAAAFGRDDPRFWLLHADRIYSAPGRRDRGLFSVLLLNLIHLRPGQGLFLPAGELHSYLDGAGVELMANSNNVLRGGLTPKHIDVDGLLRILRFDAGASTVIEARALDEVRGCYQVPAAEFQLEAWSLPAGARQHLTDTGVRLGLVLDGDLECSGNGHSLRLGPGQTCLIPAGCETSFRAVQTTTLYLAGVP